MYGISYCWEGFDITKLFQSLFSNEEGFFYEYIFQIQCLIVILQ